MGGAEDSSGSKDKPNMMVSVGMSEKENGQNPPIQDDRKMEKPRYQLRGRGTRQEGDQRNPYGG